MLNIITQITEDLHELIKDDPVRPEIPKEFRVGKDRFVATLGDETPTAMVCVNLLNYVPSSVQELGEAVEEVNTAVFYTIWSYSPGAGQALIKAAAKWLLDDYKDIKAIVTLSPQTKMAERFHLKNGATVHRTNETSVNYRYYNRE